MGGAGGTGESCHPLGTARRRRRRRPLRREGAERHRRNGGLGGSGSSESSEYSRPFESGLGIELSERGNAEREREKGIEREREERSACGEVADTKSSMTHLPDVKIMSSGPTRMARNLLGLEWRETDVTAAPRTGEPGRDRTRPWLVARARAFTHSPAPLEDGGRRGILDTSAPLALHRSAHVPCPRCPRSRTVPGRAPMHHQESRLCESQALLLF